MKSSKRHAVFFSLILLKYLVAKNNKTRSFYVLYSDKTGVFDQSERAYYPIYIINIYIYIYIYIYMHKETVNFCVE